VTAHPAVRAPAAAALFAALGAVLCAALGGCAPGAKTAPGAAFDTRQQVSLPQVKRGIDDLYRSHPAITSFAVQDVQYTVQSRDAVLKACSSGDGGPDSQAVESSRVIACAPLIFFFYSYGTKASASDSVDVAAQLYWYAITHITGPVDAQSALDELLRSWKVPVPGLSAAAAANALEASLVTAAGNSIVAQRSVHLVITGYKAGSTAVAERIAADIGATTGIESIESGPATAAIRITPANAYFSGSPAGLTTFIGLSSAAASKAASHWVAIKAGTSQYNDLAAEDTISSLPASILPTATDTVHVAAATMTGQKVYVLDWTTAASGSSTKVSEELILAATADALPVRETTTAGGDTQTVTLGDWGEHFTVPVPASAIPYSHLKS
jgi:hypothetical protein